MARFGKVADRGRLSGPRSPAACFLVLRTRPTAVLAQQVYLSLLALLAEDHQAWQYYKPLALHFRPQRRLSWRGGPLHEALGEIITWCHALGLPALPAILVRVIDGVPGDGFFVMAFPGVTHEQERLRLCRDAVARVRRAAYPTGVAGSFPGKKMPSYWPRSPRALQCPLRRELVLPLRPHVPPNETSFAA